MSSESKSLSKSDLISFALMTLTAVALSWPLDQYTKKISRTHYLVAEDAADTKIYQGRREEVLALGSGDHNLLVQMTYVRNHGASYGVMNALGEEYRVPVLVGVWAIFAAAMVVAGASALAAKKSALAWSVAGLIGGSVGNLTDRLADGYVTDFIAVKYRMGTVSFWVLPIFNIADIVIVISLLLAISQILFEQKISSGK